MKLSDLFEYGKVVPGVNMPYYMTQNEIQKQAKKFGMETDADGRPKINLAFKDDKRFDPISNMNRDEAIFGKDGTLKKS